MFNKNIMFILTHLFCCLTEEHNVSRRSIQGHSEVKATWGRDTMSGISMNFDGTELQSLQEKEIEKEEQQQQNEVSIITELWF